MKVRILPVVLGLLLVGDAFAQAKKKDAKKGAQKWRGRAAAVFSVNPNRKRNHAENDQKDVPALERLIPTQAEVRVG